MAATAATIARRSMLYESLTASRSAISSGLARANPMRMHARAYDLDMVLRMMRLSHLASRPTCDSKAKSTYASSSTTTPLDRRTARSTDAAPCHVPVGELGLTRNFSGAGSSMSSVDQVNMSLLGWGEGTASWSRHSGSSKG